MAALLLHRFSFRTTATTTASLLFSSSRAYSVSVSQSAAAAAVAGGTTTSHSYFVPRNSNGNLPVYSDIRNNGTRYITLIRNIDGQAHRLAQDLRITLFKAASSQAARAKVEVRNSKDVVITGGRFKNEVIEWLKERGF